MLRGLKNVSEQALLSRQSVLPYKGSYFCRFIVKKRGDGILVDLSNLKMHKIIQ